MTERNKGAEEITIFGETNFRNQRSAFGIKRDDRRRHMYIIGKTGMGKTTLLENMIISDIIKGEGCCYIDPHGDTAEKILDFIPNNRVNDLVYINPADMDNPIAFNIMEAVDENTKHLIASGLVGVFKKQFADSWGPRLEYILRNAILALLDYPGSTLLGVMRILVDKDFRKKVVEKIKDPVVKTFWTREFTQWSERVLQEVISPIQNKVGQFLSNSLIRNIVGQVKSSFDLRDIMDNKKILILNLAKGRIGEDTMQLIGSMIVTKLYLGAMSRVDVPEKERKDFYLYVDEFQNFATDSFADILSEARKYRLNLIMAHQYIEQLPERVIPAVFGNVGTLIAFRVGANDAEMLEKEFSPTFIIDDIVNLPAFNVYLKLMIDGIASDPFSAATLPPLYDDLNSHNKEKVIKVSRERYSNPRSVVEEKINRWSTSDDFTDKVVAATSGVLQGDRAPRQSADRRDTRPIEKLGRIEKQLETRGGERIDKGGDRNRFNKDSKIKDNKPKFEAICAACGNATELNFKPDGIRPVFCKDCLNSGLNKLKPVENTSVSIKKAETALITPVAPIKSELIRPEIIKPEAVRIEKVEKEKLVLEEVFPEAPKVAEISLFSLPVKKRIEETEEEGEEVMEESVPAVKSVPVLPNIPVSISEEKPARLVEIKSQPKNGSINKPIILNTFVKMAKNDPEVKMDQIKAPLPSVVNFDSSKKTVNVVDNLLYPEKQKVLEVKKVEDKEEGIKPGEIIHID